MKLGFVALLAFRSLADEEPSFADYLIRFNKHYADDELHERQAIYEARLAELREHNAQPGVLWEMHVNKFADEKPAKARLRMARDRNASNADIDDETRDRDASDADIDHEAEDPYRDTPLASVALKETLDWRTHEPPVLFPARNQGKCANCWAIAATEAMESRAAIRTGELLELSSQYVTDCAVKGPGCSYGGFASDAYRLVKNNGLPLQQEYPQEQKVEACHYWKAEPIVWVDGFRRPAVNHASSYMRALQDGPLSVVVDFSSPKVWAYRRGIFHGCNTKKLALNHAALLVGYGEQHGTKYWIVQNSFGTDWGEDGFIRLRRYDREPCAQDADDESFLDCGECGLLGDGSYPVGVDVEERRRLHSEAATIHI
eukprot:TRINITY_DN1688_c0_g1_i4.p1 TRINITY_DN1688_c0_g1~~TRINITY_DN1688_c0_g1_i4.p1  ORF type:complete len:373 (-),score=65.20 TRINITY_DN1688_c0_g1_i4:90-1208(-)